MNESASPRDPAGPEAQTARRDGDILALPRDNRLFLTCAVLTLALVVLTVNVWLVARTVNQQSRNSREHAFWVICQPGFTVPERTSAFHMLVAAGNKE